MNGFTKRIKQLSKSDISLTEMKKENIYNNIPKKFSDEVIENILKNKSIRIERIMSKGHSTPKEFWYDQDENEWVIVLNGKAEIFFDGDINPIQLKKGDYLNINAHVKHRVEYTDPDIETIWLAVFY